MRISRAEKSLLAEWWFTIDRVLLASILAIAGIGIILSLAASPAIALKRGLPTYYFVERHLVFTALGVAAMLAVSALSPAGVRRVALVLLAVSLAGMVLVLATGTEINGSKRWLHFGSWSLQPSEFLKPGFAVLSAWLFAEAERRPDMPAAIAAVLLYLVSAALLMAQPDVGQTLLISLVWGALFFLAGRPLTWLLSLAGLLAVGMLAAYLTLGHVQSRVDRYLNPALGDTFQTEKALHSFMEGGLLGKGPGEGTIKTVLPDAHTDFIFAVIAEEYGVLACLVILGLFALVGVRVFAWQLGASDPFRRLASAGLVLLFVLQAMINMAVNVGLVPAKGITLPFISSGGSSTLAIGVAMGMLLALTRRRPDPARLKKPGFSAKPVRYGTTGS